MADYYTILAFSFKKFSGCKPIHPLRMGKISQKRGKTPQFISPGGFDHNLGFCLLL
jgi:hypothetical protein